MIALLAMEQSKSDKSRSFMGKSSSFKVEAQITDPIQCVAQIEASKNKQMNTTLASSSSNREERFADDNALSDKVIKSSERQKSELCEEMFDSYELNVGPKGLIYFSRTASAGNSHSQKHVGSWIPALREDPVSLMMERDTITATALSDLRTSQSLSSVSLSSFSENLNIIEDGFLQEGENAAVSYNTNNAGNLIRIELQQDDEIHVLPCQCALAIMGMKDFQSTFASNFTKTIHRTTIGNFSEGAKMSRTVSGHAADTLAIDSPAFSRKTSASRDRRQSSNLSNSSSFPWPKLPPFLCFSPSNYFISIDYHEITLIRKSQRAEFCANEKLNGLKGWSSVTIRCSDHEDMDELIRVLRASSKATVVPFSQNPKFNLGKTFGLDLLDDGDDSCTSREGTITSEVLTPKKSGTQRRPVPAVIGTPPSIKKDDRKNLWSKADYCEYCSINFTLLVRRHHCRKCDKSCCEDCSKFVIVQGGEEMRLCNRCNFSVVLQQAPNSRHRRTDSQSALGKVHPRCDDFEVGTKGSLPHWRSYLLTTFNSTKRPAVGRVTVEVIEALALQRIDFNLKSNPYVRATVTGYDYDLEWNLQEWQPEKRFSLNTSYCISTLSPVWRGPGKLGGELLTLPVISTAGCILRLEVFHSGASVNASDAHPLIGIVEIPLSDIANANLRIPGSWNGFKGDVYDGFVERWYHLEKPRKSGEMRGVVLSTPIDSPLPSSTSSQAVHQGRSAMTKFVHSMDEIGQVAEKLCRAPVEWIGAALGIELPRISENEQRTSSIHVRIKLNLSEFGDLLSHSWFPPVSERPKRPPFEPDITYSRIVFISKIAAPYVRIFKFFEKSIEWKRPPAECIYFYCGVIFHIYFIKRLWIFVHVYLVIFVSIRLRKMWRIHKWDKRVASRVTFADEKLHTVGQEPTESLELDLSSNHGLTDSERANQVMIKSENPEEKEADSNFCPPSPSLVDLKGDLQNSTGVVKDEDAARLNKAIVWIAKKILSSRGMDAFQFKLGKLSKDVARLNSLWDGSSTVKSCVALLTVLISFALHCIVNRRWLWIAIVTIAHFGPSPILQKFVRWNFGLSRGLAKVVRRRHLHLMEEEKHGKWS